MLRKRTGSFGRTRFKSPRMSRPLFPGMLMSMMTISQSCARTQASASSAVFASPKVTLGKASPMVSFSPRRNTAWSSAIKTLITTLPGLGRRRQWDPQNHGGAGAGNSFNADFSIEKVRAFLHANEAQGFFRFGLCRIETFAVVVDAENELA